MSLSVWRREMYKWHSAPSPVSFQIRLNVSSHSAEGQHGAGVSNQPLLPNTWGNETCLLISTWRSDDQTEWWMLEWNRNVFETLIFILCNSFLTLFIKHQSWDSDFTIPKDHGPLFRELKKKIPRSANLKSLAISFSIFSPLYYWLPSLSPLWLDTALLPISDFENNYEMTSVITANILI